MKKKKTKKMPTKRLRDFFSVPRKECKDCKGTGYYKGDIYSRERCFTCNGNGYL